MLSTLSLFVLASGVGLTAAQGDSNLMEGVTIKVLDDAAGVDNRQAKFVMANFGRIPYGVALQGELFYPANDYGAPGHDCGEPCEWGCIPLTEADPPITLGSGTTHIVLLDRVPTAQLRASVTECTHLDKAVHAAASGADAVVIIDSDDDANIAVIKNTVEHWQKKQQLNIPVGMVTKSDGEWLKAMLYKAGGDALQIEIDFKNPVTESSEITLEFWHDSNDACGPRCENTLTVLKELSDQASLFTVESAPVKVEPHFLFAYRDEPCTTESFCKSKCVNGRYCMFEESADDPDTKKYVEEDIRRACLWQTMTTHGLALDSWYAYAKAFHAMCKSSRGTFTSSCSDQVLHMHGVLHSQHLSAYHECIALIGSDKPIPIAEKEAELAKGSKDGSVARIILNPTIRINNQQYRGDMDRDSISRAICAAFPDGAEPTECRHFGHYDCAPGSQGALFCASPSNIESHRSRCVDTFMGYDCECDVGFQETTTSKEGGRQCVDINECLVSDPCGIHTAPGGARIACHNQIGTYRCEEDVPNHCTEANGYGGCWTGSFHGHDVSACFDNLAEYQQATATGPSAALPELHSCDCSTVRGCFRDNGSGHCTPRCADSACVPDLRVCELSAPGGSVSGSGGLSMSVGALAGILVTAVVLLAALVGYVLWKHSHQVEQRVEAIVGRYVPLESSPDSARDVSPEMTSMADFPEMSRDLSRHASGSSAFQSQHQGRDAGAISGPTAFKSAHGLKRDVVDVPNPDEE